MVENTNSVEFFIDDVSFYKDTEAPYTWRLQASTGLHALTVKATDEHNNVSLAIGDIYIWR